jgi:Uma2 family endonuclease
LKAVGAATQISIEQYLRTSYRPDCDYVDGRVLERNLGERTHSVMQGALCRFFFDLREQLRVMPFLSWRTRVSRSRIRVPDLCIVRGKIPKSEIQETAPYIVIEVLSPEDGWSDMAERIEDYARFGVENIWIVDPVRRRAWRILNGAHEEAAGLTLTTTDGEVTLPLTEVFAEIDAIE